MIETKKQVALQIQLLVKEGRLFFKRLTEHVIKIL